MAVKITVFPKTKDDEAVVDLSETNGFRIELAYSRESTLDALDKALVVVDRIYMNLQKRRDRMALRAITAGKKVKKKR